MTWKRARAGVFVAVALSILACRPELPPEQRLAELRAAHEITPVGRTTVTRGDEPVTIVDLEVINRASEALPELTVVVHVVGVDGQDRLAEPVTLDLEGVRPGQVGRVSATLPGVAVGEGEEVQVELDTDLSDDELRALPEFSAVVDAG